MPIYIANGSVLAVQGQGIARNATCCCDGNEVWYSCETDEQVAILAPEAVDVDYAFLCTESLGNTWAKCYNAYVTSSAVTEPDAAVLEQCDNPAPTSCADLKGWPTTDLDSSESPCNSSAVGDNNWNIRWGYDPSNDDVTVSMTGNVLNADNGGSGTFNIASGSPNVEPHSGDFTSDFDWVITAMAASSSDAWFYLSIEFDNGHEYIIIRATEAGGRYRFFWNQGSGFNSVDELTSDTSGTLRVSRAGTTLQVFGGDGTNQIGTDKTETGSVVEYTIGWKSTSGQDFDVDINNFRLVDGSENPLYVDPSGTSCLVADFEEVTIGPITPVSVEYEEVAYGPISPITSYQYEDYRTVVATPSYIYVAQNILGGAMTLNNNAYVYVGTSTNAPTDSTADANNWNIGGFTATYADSNGKTVFSAGDNALAYYEYGTGLFSVASGFGTGFPRKRLFTLQSGVPGPTDDINKGGTNIGYQGGSYWIDSTTGYLYRCTSSTAGAATWAHTGNLGPGATSGVLRMWQSGGMQVWVNDVFTFDDTEAPYAPMNSNVLSRPVDISVGTYISVSNRVGTGTDRCHFLYFPDSH